MPSRKRTRLANSAALRSISNISGRRLAVRESLTAVGASLGLSVAQRADILSSVAGDCLVTLLTNGRPPANRRDSNVDEGRRAWDALNGLKQRYIFSPYSPPYPMVKDIAQLIHPSALATVDSVVLARTIQISNLTTFVWSILRPDEASNIMAPLDVDDDDNFRSLRSGTRGAEEKEIRTKVRRRNSLLLATWKKFWIVAVPKEQRGNEAALRLWLEFATQIEITYRLSTMSSSSLKLSLPTQPRAETLDLFSPSAVTRYGQWDDTLDLDLDEDEKIAITDLWGEMASKRVEELNLLSWEEKNERWRYEKFMEDAIDWIKQGVLSRSDNSLLTPRRRGLLLSSPDNTQSEQSDDSDASAPSDVFKIEKQLKWDTIDTNLLAEIAAELEAGTLHQPHALDEEDVIRSESPEMQMNDRHTLSSPIPSSSSNFQQLSFIHQKVDYPNGKIKGKFDWLKRQDDAVKLSWDSKSQSQDDLQRRNYQSLIKVRLSHDKAKTAKSKPNRFSEENDGEVEDEDAFPDPRQFIHPSTSQFTQTAPRKKFKKIIQIEDEAEDEAEDQDSEDALVDPYQFQTSDPDSDNSKTNTTQQIIRVDSPFDERAQEKEVSLIHTPLNRTQSRTCLTNFNSSRLQSPAIHSNTNVLIARDERENVGHRVEKVMGKDALTESPHLTRSPTRDIMPVDILPPQVQPGHTEQDDTSLSSSGFLHPLTPWNGPPQLSTIENGFNDWAAPDSCDYLDTADSNVQQLAEKPKAIVIRPLEPSEEQEDEGEEEMEEEIEELEVEQEQKEQEVMENDVIKDCETHCPVAAKLSQTDCARSDDRRTRETSCFASVDTDEDERDRVRLSSMKHKYVELSRAYTEEEADSILEGGQKPLDVQSRNTPETQEKDILRRSSRPSSMEPILTIANWRRRKVEDMNSPDPYLIDSDGSPLQTDPTYVLPLDYHFPVSELFGPVPGSESNPKIQWRYHRMTGPRQWSEDEALLLYRTVQKVPLFEEFPFRVVDYLYGEYGSKGDDLKWHHRQHMKDKMKSIVETRLNQGKSVTGRARAYARKDTKARQQWDKEIDLRWQTIQDEFDRRHKECKESSQLAREKKAKDKAEQERAEEENVEMESFEGNETRRSLSPDFDSDDSADRLSIESECESELEQVLERENTSETPKAPEILEASEAQAPKSPALQTSEETVHESPNV
nr:hypothetical protein L204_06188 [Cryptococcus depauperatus CBS 7855]